MGSHCRNDVATYCKLPVLDFCGREHLNSSNELTSKQYKTIWLIRCAPLMHHEEIGAS
jgi:hypothetical protein